VSAAAPRVVFLTYAYERGVVGEVGGFRKLWELARALERLGGDVRVLYPRLPGQRPLAAVPSCAYPVVDVPVLRPLTAYLSMVVAAFAATRRRARDVVYFRSSRTVLPLLLRALRRTRVVLEVNADAVEYERVEGAGALSRALTRWTEAANVRFADRIIALTPGLRDMLVARYGARPEAIHVVPSATDPAHFTPEDVRSARRRLGLDPDRPVVGFVGIFYRHQGVPTLLHALTQLSSTVPGVCALIVGDGAMRREWEALARRLGLEGVARFTGQVPYADVPRYFNAMDVVVAPFTADRGETSPFKVLDALACGRPVVASDIDSVRPLAAETPAVVLTPPDDPDALAKTLEGLLHDPARRHAIGAGGRGLVLARYSWERVAVALREGLASS
jgi:glycosyltransferase involved in cell wall biosynthesis